MVRSLGRLAAMITAFAVVMAAAAVLSGWARVVITQGVSMEPLYHQGDMIITTRESRYRVGDIVAYHGGTKGLIVLHRIIGGAPDAWVIKGDNNTSIDPHHPTSSQILGRAAIHVPRGGRVVRRLTSPAILGATVVVLGLFSGSAATVHGRRRRPRPQHARVRAQHRPQAHRRSAGPDGPNAMASSRRARAPAPSAPLIPRPLPAPLSTALTVVAALAVVSLVGVAMSWGRPVSTLSASRSASAPRSVQFGYSATVPRSAAYDSTRVTSPQPVFRALTDSVVVGYTYRGVNAHLSTWLRMSSANGWTSTQTLTSAAQVGARYRATTVLDMTALMDRADAAADVIGLPAGDITITLGVHVSPESGKAFTATMPMTLTSVRLTGGAPLGASSPGPGMTHTAVVPATVQLGPASIRVATLRWVSLLLALIDAAAAVVILVLARRAPVLSEGERIRRDHAAVIVPVSPVPSPNGRPIADVTDFGALAKLAERYGLAVLSWERSGVSTFVVHDEGVTYRYRTRPDDGHELDPDEAAQGSSPELDPPTTPEDDFSDFWGSAPALRRHRA